MRNILPLFLFVLFLFMGCTANPFDEVTLTVVIDEPHPWQELTYSSLWKTLVYTKGDRIVQEHVPASVQTVNVVVPRGRTSVFCAYPLGSLIPWGGFYIPGSSKTVHLTQREGVLADLLVESWALNPQALGSVDASVLGMLVGDGRLVDQHHLVMGLLDGSLQSPKFLKPLSVTFGDLPDGRWVSELVGGSSFYLLWGEEVTVSVGDGTMRWLNKERGLSLTLMVDLTERRSIATVNNAPQW
ncbi:MAG: hypothetical protein WC233_02205 [Sphaerochaeta sp.]|nr:hypothetical protein [Spirochaetales bacterium]